MPRPKHAETAEGRQHREEKYQRILEAALEVFAHKGFFEAKITEIAKLAGVADGTIYLYFKNKDDLLISVFESKLEWINATLRAELAEITEVKDRLVHLVRFHLRISRDNPKLTRFMAVETRRSSKFMNDYGKDKLMTYLDQWGAVLEEGKKVGLVDPNLSTGIMKHMLFGALDHGCNVWVTNPHRKPEDLDEIERQMTLLLRHAIAPMERLRG